MNSFDIKDNPSGEYHLYGVFPESPLSLYELAEENCFKINSAYDNTPYHDVIWDATQDPVDFDFEDYVCIVSYTSGEYYVVDLGSEVYDTIYIGGGSGGEGSGLSSAHEMDELYGSICLETRKRNYAEVSSAGYDFLDNHSQSPHSLDVMGKLYLACLMQDSSGNKITPLKTYLEELILGNPESASLIERAFYYIQKCKVALGQYQSAMDGFQQIMTQNPGTYEALVASWDYAAASLLMNGGGSGGSKSGPEYGDMASKPLSQLGAWINYDDPKDFYNEKKFTKEDRKVIRTNVVNTFKEKREKQAEKDRELQTKADNGDVLAIKELKTRSVLKEEIKAYHPETITEHTEKIQSTVKKVFAYDPGVNSKPQNTIPTDYELSQNFPNPFNPTTKIQYALPKDGKVQLVIYDILGREMAKLVNNEFRSAGRYVSEFNGSMLASGIYFYRIIVNDGKDFNSVKKMVLVK